MPGLGLLNREYEGEKVVSDSSDSSQMPWKLFTTQLQKLNQTAPSGTSYKLLYVIRHGEGEHNVKEREVGRHEWEVMKSDYLHNCGTTVKQLIILYMHRPSGLTSMGMGTRPGLTQL